VSELTFRGNLNAASWPLTTTRQGRTVVVGQLDTNFSKFQAFSGRDDDRDVGIPQALFMQNVLPTGEGYASVGYKDRIAAYGGGATDFDRCFTITNDENRKALFVPANGVAYVYTANDAAWVPGNVLAPGLFGSSQFVSVAVVQRRCFIHFEANGVWEYDFGTGLFAAVALTGLAVDLIGIASSSDYLIAIGTDNTIYYSSLTDPTDFVESLITGAGSTSAIDVRGRLRTILPINGGVILYSTENAVFMSYTGNTRLPWNFKEIAGSGGVIHPEHVTYETNLAYHYAWSSNGILRVEKNIATSVFPEATDFFTSGLFEDFDFATKTLTATKFSSSFQVKLTHIGNRYLVMSYGMLAYTHALVYDETLKRWGKLKISHTDCFSWPTPNLYGSITYGMLLDAGVEFSDLMDTSYQDLDTEQITSTAAKDDIAFLQQDGTIVTVDFDGTDDIDEGVLMLGKFTVTRAQEFQLFSVELESVAEDSASFDLDVWTSYDGKTLNSLVTSPLETLAVENLRKFETNVTGVNHTLVVTGSFALCSLELAGRQCGRR